MIMSHYQQQKQLIKETEALNSLIHVLDFKEIYKTFKPTIAEYTFFSCIHVTIPKIDCLIQTKLPDKFSNI